MKNKILNIIHNPLWIIIYLNKAGIKTLSDKRYIKVLYRIKLNKKLNLDNPVTFNEKLQWLKLHDRKDAYTTMVDKYEAKKYVANIIGEEYIIPTIGVYDRFDDIDFDKLPDQFVIKCTHDSGGLIICKDKTKLDKKNARRKINKSLRRNYYYPGREWPYKNVKPRIIIEKYIEDRDSKTVRDYKFFCFNGEPKILYVSEGSHTANQRIAFFDMQYNQLPIKRTDYKDYDRLPPKPKNFSKMKRFSAVLSNEIPHLRVDWYDINGKLFFGELTFYTQTGMIPFEDEKWDKKLGDYIDIKTMERDEN